MSEPAGSPSVAVSSLLAHFARIPVHVPRERAEEVILATHSPTLEPGFVVLPALSGALVR